MRYARYNQMNFLSLCANNAAMNTIQVYMELLVPWDQLVQHKNAKGKHIYARVQSLIQSIVYSPVSQVMQWGTVNHIYPLNTLVSRSDKEQAPKFLTLLPYIHTTCVSVGMLYWGRLCSVGFSKKNPSTFVHLICSNRKQAELFCFTQ